MPQTLMDLKREAEQRLATGNALGALKIYRLLLEALPLDFDLRFEIADIFLQARDPKAGAILQAVATHCTKAGEPLKALVALKLMESLGIATAPLQDALVRHYSAGAPTLGRSVRPAPPDYTLPLRDGIDLDYDMPPQEVSHGLAQMAAYTDNIENYPPQVPPLAIFSALQPQHFSRLVSLLALRRHRHGEAIVREAEPGEALFFIACGEVRITRNTGTGAAAREVDIARLGPGSLFGEMALLSNEPRTASVYAEGPVDVLELRREMVHALAAEIPDIRGAMMRFMQDRLIANLLAHNPIFAPFDAASRKQLLARFVGHEVPAGTIFIEQGKAGAGLFVILQGRAEVLTWSGQSFVPVATLGPGDVAGEISLLHDAPATATVRTLGSATLLFLARELFHPLVEAVPALRDHLRQLADARLTDTRDKIADARLTDDDLLEDVDGDFILV
ncbi:MAG: cyclic nucleotide-binding domain-containing protein [Myxococcales bacterium]|nr:cyclic nucleotide-binding domain-containing protein [Myxococcales bacterium]